MNRQALFVGVNDYADTAFKKLRYSLSDAVALSGAFAARGFDVEVLSNPKVETVLGAVERKSSGLGSGDVFLFFFAGHGFTAPDGSHLLICANDRSAYLRHNRAGIPVDLLEEVTNGRGCNRAFLLDACRTDLFAGVENRGAGTRDLALVSLPDAKVHAGTCCVLRSCDRFCPAMEFDDLGHGVFTRAVMDVLGDDSFCATPFGEKFVAGIRSRMDEILSAHSVVGTQNPCFQTNGEAFFLFDGVAPDQADPLRPPDSPAMVPVACPECGMYNVITSTFKCRVCGRDHLCKDHYSKDEKCCADCAAKAQVRRSADEKAPRKAEEKSRLDALPKTGDVRKLILPGGAEMEMIYCPPGEFMMGSPMTEEGRYDDEVRHRVKLTKGFWLGKYPVTQQQWVSVMGNNPSCFKGGDRPVEQVSWKDCQAFIEKVNVALGCGARLPTEAEWEYACRAGTTTPYCWGDMLNGDRANCDGNFPCGTIRKGPYLAKTTPVGKYGANAWGGCDMHGNVWEWCSDWHGAYPSGYVTDPLGPASGTDRVVRGGSWSHFARNCRSAFRLGNVPVSRDFNLGFRLACST